MVCNCTTATTTTTTTATTTDDDDDDKILIKREPLMYARCIVQGNYSTL